MIILSLGAGVQSTVMALLADRGVIEKPDCAIFADTGWEPEGVYEHLDWLESELSYPVYRVSAGNIRDDVIQGKNSTGQRFAGMPFFLAGEMAGMGRRQCTMEYKISPIQKKVRELLGYEPRKRIPENSAIQYIGISTDEIQRMKDSRVKWIKHQWPLIDLRMSRSDCLAWFARYYPGRTLAKSSCIGCPYHSDDEWRALTPEQFEDACQFDEAIRDYPKMDAKQYLHRSCIPLREVDLSTPADYGQISFLDECDGMCGM